MSDVNALAVGGETANSNERRTLMTVEFTIPGVPQGKERPRFTRNGATYTPKKTKDYEKLVAWAYQCEAHDVRFTGSVRAFIAAVYPIPKSWSKKKQQDAANNKLLPLVKPDLDNVAKAVLDACNGIAYKDDAAVTGLTVCKRYGTRPCVVVQLCGEAESNDTV